MRRIGLALLVGAVLHGGATAQVPTRDTTKTRRDTVLAIPLPADSAAADSARARLRADSLRAAALARRSADSIKAPLAHAEVPPLTDIGERYRWGRDELFASGAVSLGELLGRIPGVTGFASGWIASPHTNTYVGDFRRIRLFYDGVELDPLDPRIGPMHDFAAIPAWTLEEIVVERAAEELRVYLRSWRVNKTTPYTRADVATGDLATNSYRGFFGRRFSNSYALQVGAQQYSTEDQRAGGDGHLLSIFSRAGWAKKAWSVDGVILRTKRSRNEQKREQTAIGAFSNLPGLDATQSDAYFRIGYGNSDGARWLQLIASTSRFAETNAKTTTPPTEGVPFIGDTVDTIASRAQYVATGGVRFANTSLSATARYRVFNGEWYLTPAARLSYDRGILAATVYGEQQESDSTFRADASARLKLLPFLAVSGSLGKTRPIKGNERPASIAYRGEVGLRVGQLWATGGIMSIDTTIVPAPRAYDTLYTDVSVSRRLTFATLRGKVWKGFGVDVVAQKWPAGEPYVPEYQVRSQVYASTSWLSRFPTGNFHVLAAVQHDYRTEVIFPAANGLPQQSTQFRSISTLFELRLYDATISWQYRNVVGDIYSIVPYYTAPRAINYYGVRWDFFN
ncbi:MAG TPA: Plug domain-containing protein [Gemmatimonadaceae bacterium]|nr:Plug domain-containing protein [Gemmatimonadaceae bacterium]